MAIKFLFANNAVSTIASGILAVTTSISLNAGDGALYPAPGANQQFPVTLIDGTGNKEIVYCTGRTGDTLTVLRAQEGTSALAFDAGDKIELRVTKGVLESMMQSYDNIEPGTNILFNQAAAPVGGVQDSSVNDRVLRIVSGAGAGTGGSWTISGISVNSHTLTESEIPAHSHSGSTNSAGNHSHSYYARNYDASSTGVNAGTTNTAANALSTTSAGAHTHTVTINSTGGGGAHNHGLTIGNTWRPAYRDVIACVKS